jgi:hypothetical protein
LAVTVAIRRVAEESADQDCCERARLTRSVSVGYRIGRMGSRNDKAALAAVQFGRKVLALERARVAAVENHDNRPRARLLHHSLEPLRRYSGGIQSRHRGVTRAQHQVCAVSTAVSAEVEHQNVIGAGGPEERLGFGEDVLVAAFPKYADVVLGEQPVAGIRQCPPHHQAVRLGTQQLAKVGGIIRKGRVADQQRAVRH